MVTPFVIGWLINCFLTDTKYRISIMRRLSKYYGIVKSNIKILVYLAHRTINLGYTNV